MLNEIKRTKQNAGEPFRRWFADDYFDLIMWYEKSGEILGFQLCYDKEKQERALTYTKENGFTHEGVLSGGAIFANASPILIQDGLFNADLIIEKFKAHSRDLPREIAAYVEKMLKSYKNPKKRKSKPSRRK